MTLIDTSAWIEFFRRSGDRLVKDRVASYLDAGEAAVCGPIEFELLTGARPTETADIVEALTHCRLLEFGRTCWQRAAGLERALRARGVTVPRDDIFVAAAALDHEVALYANDEHFALMRSRGPLDLLLAT